MILIVGFSQNWIPLYHAFKENLVKGNSNTQHLTGFILELKAHCKI